MYRKLIDKLHIWQAQEKRKPLILRGARQVGKTFLVREFAEGFDTFIELNLERAHDKALFDSDNVAEVLTKAQFLKNKTIADKGSTLLFIDEIQEEPKAIMLLRYFYEERPDIHVIAAGSLLEFALSQVGSMPVGRVEYYYLHPIDFHEFLIAKGHEKLIEAFETVPIPRIAHNALLKEFHEYAVVGGMPEILAEYLQHGDAARLVDGYRNLWQVYQDDIVKYAKNDTERKVIQHIVKAAPGYLERIKFEGFGNSNYRSREVGESFRALDQARLIRLIFPSTSIDPPINADLKKRPRLQFLDTGMLNQILELQGELIGLDDLNDTHDGHIIEHIVRQELIAIGSRTDAPPRFWVREEKDSSAEVDLLYRHGKYVIPIEVKKGAQGKLRSLHQFVDRSPHHYAVRMYAGELNVERHKTPSGTSYLLLNLPYYTGTRLPEHLEWFVQNHKI